MSRVGWVSKIPGWILLAIYTIFLTGPLYILITTAIKPPTELYSNPLGLPQKIELGNFAVAFKEAKIAQYSVNSIIVVIATIAAIIIIDTACAYGIYKLFSTKIGVVFYSAIVFGMMIPSAGIVTTIILYKNVGLYNHLSAVIVSQVAASVPLAIFILVGFLRSLPKELEEAAIIDGCSDLQALRHVFLPCIVPAVVTVVLLNCIVSWNNLYGPLILTPNEKFHTMPVGLLNFRSFHSVQYNLTFAAIIMTCIPLLILYIAFQRSFVESLAGSVKG